MVSALPNLCLHDTGDGVITSVVQESRFHQTPKNGELYVLDHLLNVVVIWNSVVLMWRGFWGLGDNHFYPDDLEKSSWVSLGVGFGVLLLNIPLQILGNMIFRWSLNKGWPLAFRVVLEDNLIFVANFGVIHHWRRVWLMQDVYFFPDHENLSLSPGISHIAGSLAISNMNRIRELLRESLTVNFEEALNYRHSYARDARRHLRAARARDCFHLPRGNQRILRGQKANVQLANTGGQKFAENKEPESKRIHHCQIATTWKAPNLCIFY
ncbi:hypothetical protein CAPTEDRAFT_196766 [Capitella teleta]|uniref:Uncharacterized protein n=1 Tax=Capitella teleta TaxID=283909 RepID=R7TE31_CAPTE|nr:hypothetical protein CAPTEDRAFT_196766 [Capitella teleta]|eukprot:ELT91984.1 hypothetical protein CAPTEDRAFT_196766 [Capitella teleta]